MDLKNTDITLKSEASEVVTSMRRKNRHMRLYDGILGALLILLGAGFFYVLSSAIEQKTFLFAIFAFTLYIVTYLLLAITAGIKKVAIIATALSFATSAFYEPHLIHFGIILIASLFAWRSVVVARKTLFGSIKIDSGNAMYVGIMGFVFAASLVMSSQYYFTISRLQSNDLVERIVEANSGTVNATRFIVQNLASDDGAQGAVQSGTVDAFLTDILLRKEGSQSSSSSFLSTITKNLGLNEVLVNTTVDQTTTKVFEESFVHEARQALSENIGMTLDGSEDVVDILSVFMKLRAQNLVQENKSISYALPVILSVFFFVTVVSIGSLLRYPWMWIAQFIFWLLKLYGAIKVIYVQKQVEVIKF